MPQCKAMRLHARAVIVNVISFQLLWAAAVLGAAQGVSVLAWGVLGVMVVAQVALTRQWRQDLLLIASGGLLCVLMEPLWVRPAVLQYRNWLQPLWAPQGRAGEANGRKHSPGPRPAQSLFRGYRPQGTRTGHAVR